MRARRQRAMAFLILLGFSMALAFLGTVTVGAQSPASIGGMVTDGRGPVDGVAVDLFTADADGNRTRWLRSTISGTEDSGTFRFDVEPGCYAVTVIAPQDRAFVDGGRWANIGLCVVQDESRLDINAVLRSDGSGRVSGTVNVEDVGPLDHVPLDHVVVDLFTAQGDGTRGQWLRSTVSGTDAPGLFSFDNLAGCYVMTFIGPDGFVFVDSAGRWFNRSFCIEPGEQIDGQDALLRRTDAPTTHRLTAQILHGDLPVSDVAVDLFADDGTGGRGQFISFTTTDEDGVATFAIADGCWIITMIAPDNDVFEDSAFEDGGTRWLNRRFCTSPDQETYSFQEVLSGEPLTCASGSEFERIFRDDFDDAVLSADNWISYDGVGNAGFGVRRPSAVTVEGGHLVITAEMDDETLVHGGLLHRLDQQYGKYRFRARTDQDPSQAASGVVLTWPQSGVHPRDGGNFIYETLVQGPERNPFFSSIQKPFGSIGDQQLLVHNADASRFQTMTMVWTPQRITITREGPGGSQFSETHVINETAEDLLPDNPHHLSIQLDAWKHSIESPVRMEVDWVEVHKYCG